MERLIIVYLKSKATVDCWGLVQRNEKCMGFVQGLLRLLPGDELRPGPVVGRRKGDGSLVFGGMDDWLWELYEGHAPRLAGEVTSFDCEAALAALEERSRAQLFSCFSSMASGRRALCLGWLCFGGRDP